MMAKIGVCQLDLQLLTQSRRYSVPDSSWRQYGIHLLEDFISFSWRYKSMRVNCRLRTPDLGKLTGTDNEIQNICDTAVVEIGRHWLSDAELCAAAGGGTDSVMLSSVQLQEVTPTQWCWALCSYRRWHWLSDAELCAAAGGGTDRNAKLCAAAGGGTDSVMLSSVQLQEMATIQWCWALCSCRR